VVKGDSLSKIASGQYGNAQKWRRIYEANRDLIKDPDLIYPGQQLRIPE
jgi:nucleoid-associated protein YgaU